VAKIWRQQGPAASEDRYNSLGIAEKLLSVDSTNVRAHQHCAGARCDTLATGDSVELQEICR
jgi:hypothetical protein